MSRRACAPHVENGLSPVMRNRKFHFALCWNMFMCLPPAGESHLYGRTDGVPRFENNFSAATPRAFTDGVNRYLNIGFTSPPLFASLVRCNGIRYTADLSCNGDFVTYYTRISDRGPGIQRWPDRGNYNTYVGFKIAPWEYNEG